MIGFGLLVGHLIGDYLLQNDWLARNKTNPHPGPEPSPPPQQSIAVGTAYVAATTAWQHRRDAWLLGHLACTLHCLLYTFAVWLCACWWLPLWGVLACFLCHWPIDRFGLARRWMDNVSGQRDFAAGACSPWSVIVVDNTFHLLTLFVIALVAGA